MAKEFQRDKLADLLEMMNITAVARKAVIRPETIRRWLSGEHQPQDRMVRRLAMALELDPAWFYEHDEADTRKEVER